MTIWCGAVTRDVDPLDIAAIPARLIAEAHAQAALAGFSIWIAAWRGCHCVTPFPPGARETKALAYLAEVRPPRHARAALAAIWPDVVDLVQARESAARNALEEWLWSAIYRDGLANV